MTRSHSECRADARGYVGQQPRWLPACAQGTQGPSLLNPSNMVQELPLQALNAQSRDDL